MPGLYLQPGNCVTVICTDSLIEFVECAVSKSQTILLHNINFIATFYKISHCHITYLNYDLSSEH